MGASTEPLLVPDAARQASRSTLLAVSYVVLVSRYTIATFLSAFFSPLATQWGISPSFNGAIFAAYPLGMALTSLVAPRIIAAIGSRVSVTGGLILGSVATVVFGIVPDVVPAESTWAHWFFLISYLINGLTGALAETACIILLTSRFQDRLGAVMASVGSVCAVGCMVGPVVGGILYDSTPEYLGDAWRFRMPFVVCAVSGVLIAVAIHNTIPQEFLGGGSRDDIPTSSTTAILTPSVLINLVAVALSGTAVATLDPTLPYRLSAPPFGFSASIVSGFILFSSLVYIGVSVPIGWLVDTFPGRSALFKLLTGSGFLALALAFGLLAPIRWPLDGPNLTPSGTSSSDGILSSVPILLVAMAIKGVGSALSNNAIYPDLVIGFDEDDTLTQATISALWNAAYAIGWAVGPFLGGWLYGVLLHTPLCMADDLTGCDGVPAAADATSLEAASEAAQSGLDGGGCSCEWRPDNGFDGFSTVIAAGCLAFGLVCFIAAAMSTASDTATPPTGGLSKEVEAANPSPADETFDEPQSDEGLLLTFMGLTGPPSRYTAPRILLSKAPSHRSIASGSRRGGRSRVVTSVDAALERLGLGCFHVFTLPVLCLASMAQSLQTNLLSYIQPCASAAFGINAQEIGTLSAVVFFASAIATPSFGVLADAKGRKIATIISLSLMVMANIGSAAAPSFGVLCAFQALAGVGLGGTMVPFDLLAELSPPSTRGAVLNASSWTWSVGTMTVALVAAVSVSAGNSNGWRVLVSSINMPLLATTCLLPLLSESPHWLMHRGRALEALAVLKRIATFNGVTLPSSRLQSRSASSTSLTQEGYCPPAPTAGTGGGTGPGAGPRNGPDPGLCSAVSNSCDAGGGSDVGSWSSGSLPSLDRRVNVNPITGSVSSLPIATMKDWETEIADGGNDPDASNADARAQDTNSQTGRTAHLGLRELLSDPVLRRRTMIHWSLWAIAGFGWTGLVFFGTFVRETDATVERSIADDRNDAGVYAGAKAAAALKFMARVAGRRLEAGTSDGGGVHHSSKWKALDEGGCNFDYRSQFMVVASEIPGALLVHFVVDRPRGPFGLLGGRRGVQALAYILCGILATLMSQEQLLGANGVLLASCLSRAMLAAGNSAMWIAAPEMYPTYARGLGANTAFLANVLGSVPASMLVYTNVLPRWAVAAGIGAANLISGFLALALPETAGIDLE